MWHQPTSNGRVRHARGRATAASNALGAGGLEPATGTVVATAVAVVAADAGRERGRGAVAPERREEREEAEGVSDPASAVAGEALNW